MKPSELFINTGARLKNCPEFATMAPWIVYAAPSFKLCPNATKECMMGCYGGAIGTGYLEMERASKPDGPIWAKRLERRSVLEGWAEHGISDQEVAAISTYLRKASKGKQMAIRINGTSDVHPSKYVKLMDAIPEAVWYDYSKRHDTIEWKLAERPSLHMTYSYAGPKDIPFAEKCLSLGINVAVVFKDDLPETFLGAEVLDGDVSEARFNDPPNRVVGLRLRGNRINKAYDGGKLREFVVGQ